MTNSPASEASHNSGDDEAQDGAAQHSKNPAVKDKACQYCQQKFTSSSLGRHLDQFISKKKPDGIHDVDEIRRLRGGITRRTARNHNKKEQDDTQSTQHSPSPQYTLPSYSELLTKTATAPPDVRFTFNRMNWQATGVITDPANLNPPTVNVVSPPVSNPPTSSVTGTKRNFSTYASDLPASTSAISETARALELSLREVLDAVRTATKRAAPSSQPFSFDFNAQSFPYLCLSLLQAPPTLFTPTPFATPTSVPLNPPGPEQYQQLRKTIETHIETWKWARLSHAQRTSSSANMSEEMDTIGDSAAGHLQNALQHLDAAYQHFMSFSPESRQGLWTVELLRAFKKEQDKVKDAQARIEKLEQDTNQLQQQIDHLSRCQWPREMALWPPDRVTLDENIRNELGGINLLKSETNGLSNGSADVTTDDQQRNSTERWDYDLLVNKWKKHVREDRNRRTGMQPAAQFSPAGGPPPPPPPLPENHTYAPSEHSTASTPQMHGGLVKPAVREHRGGSTGQSGEATSLHNSPIVNGSSNGATSGPVGFDSRRRNIQVISDMDDIFTPRLKGLRADSIMKSTTP